MSRKVDPMQMAPLLFEVVNEGLVYVGNEEVGLHEGLAAAEVGCTGH